MRKKVKKVKKLKSPCLSMFYFYFSHSQKKIFLYIPEKTGYNG